MATDKMSMMLFSNRLITHGLTRVIQTDDFSLSGKVADMAVNGAQSDGRLQSACVCVNLLQCQGPRFPPQNFFDGLALSGVADHFGS